MTEQLVVELCDTLADYANKKGFTHGIRYTGTGLFIEEERTAPVARLTAQHIIKKRSGLILGSTEIHNAFSEQPGTHYLVPNEHPNRVRVGWHFPKETLPSESVLEQLTHTPGRIINCRNNLHPNDPLFTHNPLKPSAREFFATILVDNKEYQVSWHAYTRFNERLGKEENMTAARKNMRLKYLSWDTQLLTQRGKLFTFYHHFMSAVPVKRKNVVRQLLKHNLVPTTYRVNDHFVYVIEENNGLNIVKTCYEKENISYEYKLK